MNKAAMKAFWMRARVLEAVMPGVLFEVLRKVFWGSIRCLPANGIAVGEGKMWSSERTNEP